MKKSFKISITEPCHENWNKMTPNEQGRHCASCEKTVVDFTRKTDREIAKIVKGGGSLCGRFKKEQLERPITLPRKRDAFFEMIPPSYAASLLIPVAIFGTQNMQAQEPPVNPTEIVKPKALSQSDVQGKIRVEPNISKTFILKGNVSDENGPLPGANVIIKGTNRGTQTDFDGNYEIEISRGETITTQFIGYADQEILIGPSNNTRLNIFMNYDNEIMGEIIITGMLRTTPTPQEEKTSVEKGEKH